VRAAAGLGDHGAHSHDGLVSNDGRLVVLSVDLLLRLLARVPLQHLGVLVFVDRLSVAVVLELSSLASLGL
jgi:hypothetical protein